MKVLKKYSRAIVLVLLIILYIWFLGYRPTMKWALSSGIKSSENPQIVSTEKIKNGVYVVYELNESGIRDEAEIKKLGFLWRYVKQPSEK